MSDSGRVSGVFRYPVKSLQGERIEVALVNDRGVVGDRRWGVRDLATGAVLSAKREPRLLHVTAAARGEGVAITVPGEPTVTGSGADAALSRFLGREVALDIAPEVGPAYVDEADVHLLGTDELGTWPVRRFRPNIMVEGGAALVELVGQQVSIGGVRLEITKRTKRCAMTTAAQPGIAKDVGVLRTLAATSALCLGVYARVVTPGQVHAGDSIRPL